MNDDIKQNLQESSIWIRGLYMLLFALFYSVAEMVLFAVVVFQFLFKLFTGETNERLLDLGQSLATYIYQILQFLNFNTETHPYPFGEWPQSGPVDRDDTFGEDDEFSGSAADDSAESSVADVDVADGELASTDSLGQDDAASASDKHNKE